MQPELASPPELDQRLLQAARLWVVHHRPYYASVLFRCPIVPTYTSATFAVDRYWRIYINPAYANGLSVERFAAALIHEVNHVIRAHDERATAAGVNSHEEHLRWNLAGDAELNDDLRDDDLDVDTENWVFPWTFGLPTDQTAEQYYPRITLETLEKGIDGDGSTSNDAEHDGPRPHECGSGSGGNKIDGELSPDDTNAPPVSEVEGRILRRRVAEEVIRHAHRGDVPGGLLDWAHREVNPKVDWRKELQAVVRSALYGSGQADYSYRRFSRRDGAGHQVRWPGMVRPTPQVAVVVDTSASMDEDQLMQCLAEISGILKSSSIADDCVRVITCDTDVADDVVVASVSRIRRYARGGTDMRVGIEQALRGRPRPEVLVVLTDGFTPWPERIAGVRCVVALIGDDAADPDSVPTWARVIQVAD